MSNRRKKYVFTALFLVMILLTWVTYLDLGGIQDKTRMALNAIIPVFDSHTVTANRESRARAPIRTLTYSESKPEKQQELQGSEWRNIVPLQISNAIESKAAQVKVTPGEERPVRVEVDKSSFGEQCKQSCPPEDIMCQPKTYDAWNELLTSDKVRYKPVIPPGTYVYPWEKELLGFPPLQDSKMLPDLKLSTFTLSGEDGGEVTCDVGQRLTGRIDLRDGYGNPRKVGLDEVRAWIEELNGLRKVTAQVTDLGNGRYALGVTCPWPGVIAMLRVAVSYPREFLRSVVHQMNAGLGRYSVGLFQSKDVNETTVCHVTPNIPGRDCLCNFTAVAATSKRSLNSENSRGMYCGRPLDERLNCSHWVSTQVLDMPQPYNVTPAERKMVMGMAGSFRDRALKKSVRVFMTIAGEMPPLKPCFETPTEVTWDHTSRPQGFWKGKEWTSFLCQQVALDATFYRRCLKDSTIYIIGDSNANRLYSEFIAQTKSRETIPGAWPFPGQAKNSKWNITIEFRTHDKAVFLGQGWKPLFSTGGSVESLLDAIPSGRALVIIHYYLHMMPFHLSVAQSRIQAAARGVARLLQRNPNAFVAVRGPHVSSRDWDWNHALGGDPLGLKLLDILDEAFAGMRGRVLFLDGWDMTIAMQNEKYHPANQVLSALIHKFTSFLCKS